jgi:hypothetical protein
MQPSLASWTIWKELGQFPDVLSKFDVNFLLRLLVLFVTPIALSFKKIKILFTFPSPNLLAINNSVYMCPSLVLACRSIFLALPEWWEMFIECGPSFIRNVMFPHVSSITVSIVSCLLSSTCASSEMPCLTDLYVFFFFFFSSGELYSFGLKWLDHTDARAHEERFGLVGMHASDDEDDT